MASGTIKGSDLRIPNYSTQEVILSDSAMTTRLNYSPTQDGWIFVLTNSSSLKNVNLLEDNSIFSSACNSLLFPVKAGHTYTSDNGIRVAYYFKNF